MRTALVVIVVAVSLFATGCARTAVTEEPVASGGEACEYQVTGAGAKQVDPPQADHVADTGQAMFTLTFSGGEVTITMDRTTAPCAVNSFESLVAQDYFNDTACHRLADSGNFLLQCGDPTGKGSGGPGYVFADELTGDETYPQGTVAMANDGPDTNGSQFFMVYRDSQLPPDYTVLGHFDDAGREVIEGIAAEGQDGSNDDGSGVPNNPAVIESITAG